MSAEIAQATHPGDISGAWDAFFPGKCPQRAGRYSHGPNCAEHQHYDDE